uniref:SCP domain-containing protein n=1 Tax=Monopterus albus TaxID=43700 RepID=A0A3Q3JEJ0_MONAL
VGMVKILLWAWMFLDWGVCSVLLPEITDGKFIEECIREHNRARSSVTPPANKMFYMTWDEGLAITARAWAKYCVFEHNIHLKDTRRMHPTFSSVGENIWVGYPPSSFSVKIAIENWVNEKQYYNYNSNTCSKVCGHYTQVVWASSYKVGCATQLCPNGIREEFSPNEGAIFVCNYAPAGNIDGRKPYDSEGANISAPTTLFAGYNWTPDWDPSPSTTGSSYVSVLIVAIIRPIALIFTFITAYVVQYHYPNVFCYE